MRKHLSMTFNGIVKRALCFVLSFAIIFTAMSWSSSFVFVSKAADIDPFQKFMIESMASPSKSELINSVLIIIKTENDITDAIVSTALNILTKMTESEIREALGIYAQRKDESKTGIQGLIEFPFCEFENIIKTFPMLTEDFNALFTGNSTDNNGINYFATLMQITFLQTWKAIATDGTPETNIDFDSTILYGEDRNKINSAINLMSSLESQIKSYNGFDNFDKLMNFVESMVNNRPHEILNFKKFLQDYLNAYSGALPVPSTPTPTPTPTPTSLSISVATTPTPTPTLASDSMVDEIDNAVDSYDNNSRDPMIELKETSTRIEDALAKISNINVQTIKSVENSVKNFVASVTISINNTDNIGQSVKMFEVLANTVGKALDITNTYQSGMEETVTVIMSKTSIQVLPHKMEGENADVVVNESQMPTFEEEISDSLECKKQLTEILTKNGIDEMINDKVQLKLKIDSDSKNINMSIPSLLLQKISDAGAVVEIVTPIASLTVDKGIIDTEGVLTFGLKTTTAYGKEAVQLNASVNVAGQQEQKLSVFNKKITVKIPYNLNLNENDEKLTVFYVNPNGTKENMSGRFILQNTIENDKNMGFVQFETGHFSTYLVDSVDAFFKDIQTNWDWAKNPVEVLASKGIIKGRANERFEPNGMVTRAEFAKLVVLTLGLDIEDYETVFRDVNDRDWYSKYVVAVSREKLINGKGEGLFYPEVGITRQEMAVVLANVLKKYEKKLSSSTNPAFSDKDNIAKWAQNSICIVADYGLMKGNKGYFNPKDKVSRAEAATVIYRFYSMNLK